MQINRKPLDLPLRESAQIAEQKIPTLETLSREKSKATINQLWVRMTDSYGAKFTSNYGESPSSTWELLLQPFTQEQIGKAFSYCLFDYPEWPPSLPQFVELCQGLTKAFKQSLEIEPSEFDIGINNLSETQIRKYAEQARDREIARIRRTLQSDPQYVHKQLAHDKKYLPRAEG